MEEVKPDNSYSIFHGKNINLVCCICRNPSQIIYDAEEEGLFLFCEFHMEEFRRFCLPSVKDKEGGYVCQNR